MIAKLVYIVHSKSLWVMAIITLLDGFEKSWEGPHLCDDQCAISILFIYIICIIIFMSFYIYICIIYIYVLHIYIIYICIGIYDHDAFLGMPRRPGTHRGVARCDLRLSLHHLVRRRDQGLSEVFEGGKGS